MNDCSGLIGQLVSVHLNLTRGDFVIAPKPKGPVLAYTESVTLTEVTFKISEAQRQYCVNKNGRWVHAFALGRLESLEPIETEGLLQITYNPFRAPTFHVVGQERPVTEAEQITFQDRYGWIRP